MAETFVQQAIEHPLRFMGAVAVAVGGIVYPWWQQFLSSPLNVLTGIGGLIALAILIDNRIQVSKNARLDRRIKQATLRKLESR